MSLAESTVDDARLERPQDLQEEIDRVNKPEDQGELEQSRLRHEEIDEGHRA